MVNVRHMKNEPWEKTTREKETSSMSPLRKQPHLSPPGGGAEVTGLDSPPAR